MGCLCKLNNKILINVITSNKNLSKFYEKDDESKADQINTFQQNNNEDINCQTNISQNIEHLIENNPIPFVKIKKKKQLM